MKRLLILLGLINVVLGAWGCACAEADVRIYADLDKPIMLSGRCDRVVVKVSLDCPRAPLVRKRLPINVAIVLDKSGSMASDFKMEKAKRGAVEIIERLTRDDVVSVIVYDSGPRVIIPAQPVRDKDAMIEAVSNIYAGGSTALYGGVALGAVQVRRNLSWKYVNRVILLSDGLANVGPQTTRELACLGASLNEEGMTVSTIGVGLDYNEDLMTTLAARSGGNSYFAASANELPRIFAEEIGEAMTVVARDIRINVRCPGGLRPVGVVGREGEITGQAMSATVGELYGENEKFALFEIEVPEDKAAGRLNVADVQVEYTDPYTNEQVEKSLTAAVAFGRDEEAVREGTNKEVAKDVALARTSEARREAVRLADKGDFNAAAGVLKANALSLERAAVECDNDAAMVSEAEECKKISLDVSAGQCMTSYQRKRMVNQAHTQTTQQGYVPDDTLEVKEDTD